MRYELTDEQWAAIKPILPNKPRGVPRASSGSCDLERHGAIGRSSVTTCNNRFVPCGRAGVWARIMSALTGAHDAAV